jgi:hypothetical protein
MPLACLRLPAVESCGATGITRLIVGAYAYFGNYSTIAVIDSTDNIATPLLNVIGETQQCGHNFW